MSERSAKLLLIFVFISRGTSFLFSKTLLQTLSPLDILAVAPCTGNTLAKLAAGIADGPVTFACKAHLRNLRPVVVAVSTNDGLAAAAANIGALLNRKNYYFVPFGQDDPAAKPCSLKADLGLLGDTLSAALEGRQLQPLLR